MSKKNVIDEILILISILINYIPDDEQIKLRERLKEIWELNYESEE